MSEFQLYMRHEAMEALRSLPPRNRRAVRDFIETLTQEPGRLGDFQEFDDTGRPLEVTIIGALAVTFWCDHAVREVKVMRICSADKV